MQEVLTPKGSRFLLCQLSSRDPAFPKYPPQPVVRCEGYRRKLQTEGFEIAAEASNSPDAARLIAELSAELARRYDHVDDGSGHFRPEDTAVPRSVFLIGHLDGLAIACGALRPIEEDVGEVNRMYVSPAFRGQGLSKRLLAALEDAARQMGYITLRLETGDRQPEAIRLYESAGYRRIEPFGIYVGDPRSVCFEKRLN
jgi:GNAT superfamily N-acetyltransferase